MVVVEQDSERTSLPTSLFSTAGSVLRLNAASSWAIWSLVPDRVDSFDVGLSSSFEGTSPLLVLALWLLRRAAVVDIVATVGRISCGKARRTSGTDIVVVCRWDCSVVVADIWYRCVDYEGVCVLCVGEMWSADSGVVASKVEEGMSLRLFWDH